MNMDAVLKEVLCSIAVVIFTVGLCYTLYHLYRFVSRTCFLLAFWWQSIKDDSVDNVVKHNRHLEEQNRCMKRHGERQDRRIAWLILIIEELYKYQREDSPMKKYQCHEFIDAANNQTTETKLRFPTRDMTFEDIFK